MRILLVSLTLAAMAAAVFPQMNSAESNATPTVPEIEPGVSLQLARWRAARYSDVRYKLNLTLEKMSPVLKGTIEIRVKVRDENGEMKNGLPIILDWRKIKGHEEKSTVRSVTVNGVAARVSPSLTVGLPQPNAEAGTPAVEVPDPDAKARASARAVSGVTYRERDEHLIFADGVVAGENVIRLDFTSPILTSGSAITRYIDKEDGSEYIYSLFVPSDASTAFPVFDQPDLKARFELAGLFPDGWTIVSNSSGGRYGTNDCPTVIPNQPACLQTFRFEATQPISTYVFAFAAGPFQRFLEVSKFPGIVRSENCDPKLGDDVGRVCSHIYVRKSQAAKFKPHAAEVFRLNHEAVRYFEEYFDYKFPFPKYDLVLIPEFPFGGMEHAGATFLRESAIIFPQEPTKNDHISRALLIFHEAAHQWFGDTVTMRWFDDLWLKEGFATFTAYKAMERIMPEMMAWKVFYERVKQAAYQTDSTKGTTPIYQEIPNLSAAKSAYGNIVYNKAPAFLRQAEFYLGEDKFRTAVRAFLKKHEFGNGRWEDLVSDFARAKYDLGPSGSTISPQQALGAQNLVSWAKGWIHQRGLPIIRSNTDKLIQQDPFNENGKWIQSFKIYAFEKNSDARHKDSVYVESTLIGPEGKNLGNSQTKATFRFPNYGDYGYGIFLLDEKSRDYVLKNIQNERDPFLRSMMWGALWDSVREGELDPREYVELVLNVLMQKLAREQGRNEQRPDTALAHARASALEDESTTALLLNRVVTAMNYYIDDSRSAGLRPRAEDLLIERMRNAETLGQRITYYRAFLNIAASENARRVLKEMLKGGEGVSRKDAKTQSGEPIPLKTKDRFDIVTRLLILGDPDAERLLAELEKREAGDDAKRYAYAARAGIATAENKAKYWNDFVNNKEISESWIEAAFGPWNSIRHSELTLPYLERALNELPNHKRSRKIFFVNGWLGAFIGGQRSEEALNIVNKFLTDNPTLDKDLRLKILENADIIERAVKIRKLATN